MCLGGDGVGPRATYRVSLGAITTEQSMSPAKRAASRPSSELIGGHRSKGDERDHHRTFRRHRSHSFCAGNDLEDFLKNPPGPGASPQARLMNALLDFDKPLVAAVHGAAIGGGTTMLTHCDFVYAGESAKFQMPFINLAVVPEFGSRWSVPARIGHLHAAELILLGL